jgi:hypothetical protein
MRKRAELPGASASKSAHFGAMFPQELASTILQNSAPPSIREQLNLVAEPSYLKPIRT